MSAPAIDRPGSAGHAELLERWRQAWPQALAAWSVYTLLRHPRFLDGAREAGTEGMAGEIAAIRLSDHAVMVNVTEVLAHGLAGDALAILAHEIGHHVYVPGNLTDHGRVIAAMQRMLEGLPATAVQLTANLYADLLINDRLQHRAGIDILAVYRKLTSRPTAGGSSCVWTLYCRIYEHLWRLPAGTLALGDIPAAMDADAMLLARLVRVFAREWLMGARRFAVVLYPYLAKDQAAQRGQTFVEFGLHDTRGAGAAGTGNPAEAIPDGLVSTDPSETGDDDAFDQDIDDPLGAAPGSAPREQAGTAAAGQDARAQSRRQYREPFAYGALLESLGLNLSQHEITTRYYRERALRHLIPFPRQRAAQVTEPFPEGEMEWGIGDTLESLDIMGSVLRSPRIIPGITTVQRVEGLAPGSEPAPIPVDLDIYVDSSGSMPNPAITVSYLALCATILALSALRAGARVQATLWSSAGRFETTGGFISDERRVIGTVVGCLSGGTAFPLHVLRKTYFERAADAPAAHIVVISDDGCDTMLSRDEQGEQGSAIAATALAKARGGGTLVLNLPRIEAWAARTRLEELGFGIHAVQDWPDLVAFAQDFVRRQYGMGA